MAPKSSGADADWLSGVRCAAPADLLCAEGGLAKSCGALTRELVASTCPNGLDEGCESELAFMGAAFCAVKAAGRENKTELFFPEGVASLLAAAVLRFPRAEVALVEAAAFVDTPAEDEMENTVLF